MLARDWLYQRKENSRIKKERDRYKKELKSVREQLEKERRIDAPDTSYGLPEMGAEI
jgi:hypothetical protein